MINEAKKSRDVRAFQRALLRWYKKNGRDLPWRHTTDSYRILVSEVMLQQTQVDRVIEKYKQFLKRFPNVRALAHAPTASVIHSWSGLGYNRRALYLKRTAEEVLRQFHGRFPRTVEELQSLPGIGPYTARAICAFAYNYDVCAVDTNIERIIRRWRFGKRRVATSTVWSIAQRLVPKGKGRLWNSALMDFGALVCTSNNPQCAESSLAGFFPACATIRVSEKRRTSKGPFHTTDRYWRGRVVEYLRLQHDHSARGETMRLALPRRCPRPRLRRVLDGLARDGLVVRHGAHISLP